MSDLLDEELYIDITDMIEDYKSEVEDESNELESDRSVLSGNDINNYYYHKTVNVTNVSNNEIVEDPLPVFNESLSYNIINKPINDYTVIESLFLFSIVIGLFVLFLLLVRRSIFKWK